jgi:TPR repeat protein
VGTLLYLPDSLHAQAPTNPQRQSPYSAAAIAALQRQAEAGDANAQFRLGISYEHGIGVHQDLAQAFSWYQKSAAQGNAHGEFYLGTMYLNGTGVQKDYPSALLLFQQAVAQGHAAAEDNLGAMYQYGLGVPKDNAQAFAWYQKAAAQGSAPAENNLGWMYQNGLGIQRDYGQAFAWYQKAAESGYPPAEDNLGWMYQNGIDVKLNDFQAVAWYQKAAAQLYAGAQNHLGWMYENGHGVPQDYTQALTWYQRAAEQGSADAENNLGWMYENGQGVQKDNAQAIAWYQKSVAQGNNFAKKNLDKLNQRLASAPSATATTPAANTESDNASIEIRCDLPKDSGEGLAIFSGTMPPGFARFSYFYEPESGSRLMKGLKERSINLRLEHGSITSDFTAVPGRLFILRLPAGTYEFHSWAYQSLAMEEDRPRGIHPLTFGIEGGRAVYLGGFDPIVFQRKEGLFNTRVNKAWVLVRDDHTRDLPVLFNKCPGLDRALLDVKVMDTSPWLPPKKK